MQRSAWKRERYFRQSPMTSEMPVYRHNESFFSEVHTSALQAQFRKRFHPEYWPHRLQPSRSPAFSQAAVSPFRECDTLRFLFSFFWSENCWCKIERSVQIFQLHEHSDLKWSVMLPGSLANLPPDLPSYNTSSPLKWPSIHREYMTSGYFSDWKWQALCKSIYSRCSPPVVRTVKVSVIFWYISSLVRLPR